MDEIVSHMNSLSYYPIIPTEIITSVQVVSYWLLIDDVVVCNVNNRSTNNEQRFSQYP